MACGAPGSPAVVVWLIPAFRSEDSSYPSCGTFAAAAHPSHQPSRGSAATREWAICTGPDLGLTFGRRIGRPSPGADGVACSGLNPALLRPQGEVAAGSPEGCTHIRQRVAPRMLVPQEGRYAPPVHLIKLTATQRSRRSIGDTCPEYPADCGRLRAARNRSDSTVRTVRKTGELLIGHTQSRATGNSLDLNR